MKNILILGAARSGKSTLAKMIAEKLGFSIISVDAFISAFQENYADIGFKHHGKNNHLIAPFIASYVNAITYNFPNSNFVIEGYHITLSDAKKLFGNEFNIIVLGYPKLSEEQVLANVRRYEGKFDYTKAIPDDELLNIVSHHVEYSQKAETECKTLGIRFYDTSYNREKILDNLLNQLAALK